jgi:chromosome partitioning protein
LRQEVGESEGSSLGSDATAGFWRISSVLRNVQRTAIEIENAPDKRKRLRSFTVPEIADLLDVERVDLLAACGQADQGRFQSRTLLSFLDVQTARKALATQRGDLRFQPRRDPEKGESLAIVAFANFKGGSGKTTSAVHFAQHMALSGYRVLVVDLDSQGSATALFGIDPGREVTQTNSFTGWLERGGALSSSLSLKTYWPSIDLLAGGPILQQAEFALAQRAAVPGGSATPHWAELARYLASVQDQYDVSVLDTRPDVNMLMVNALHTATGVVVPTQATMVDLSSTGEFFGFLGGYIDQMKPLIGVAAPAFAFAKVLVTRFLPTEKSQVALWDLMKSRFGAALLPQPMLHTAVMGTAGVAKETIYEYEPANDRKAYDRAVASLMAVNRSLEAEILRFWGRPVPWKTLTEEQFA